MFSPGRPEPPRPLPKRSDQTSDDDDDWQSPSLIRKLAFTTKTCMTPGRALKRPSSKSEAVKVYLRLRPHVLSNMEVADSQSIAIRHPQSGATSLYTFSQVFDGSTSQSSLYQDTTAPLVQSLFDGYNALLFTYGITNSGKTYSIMGNSADRGILPRTIQDVFEQINQSETSLDVYASYLEVHNNIIIDLLRAETISKPLALVTTKTGHVFIKNLHEVKIDSIDDAELVISEGARNRQCAETALNTSSSRSHAIFSLKLVKRGCDKDKDGIISKFCIVDLAGSERTSRAKNADEHRCRETNNINKSLMQLGRCLEVIRWNQSHPDLKARPVPWRDSKLSRLFKDYFVGGWGRAVMIATVNPDPDDYDETCHALKFAALASEVESVSKISSRQIGTEANNLADRGNVVDVEEELLEQIYHLKRELLYSEKSRKEMEVSIHDSVCNELTSQSEEQERLHREELEKNDERVRHIADMRSEIWKKRVICESGGIDVQAAIDAAVTKAQKDYQHEVQRLREKLDRSELELSTLEAAQKDLSVAEKERQELTRQNALLEQNICEMTVTLEEQESASRQNQNNLKQKIADLEKNLDQVDADLEQSIEQADHRALQLATKEISFKKQTDVNEKTIVGLKEKLEELTSTNKKLRQDVAVTSNQFEEMNQAAIALQSQLDVSMAKSFSQSDTIQALQKDIEGHLVCIELHVNKEAALQAYVSQLAKFASSQSDSIVQIMDNLSNSERERETMKEHVTKMESYRAAFVEMLSCASLTLSADDTLHQLVVQLQDTMERLQDTEATLVAKIVRKLQQYSELEQERSSFMDANRVLHDRVAELEQALQVSKGSNIKHRSRLEEHTIDSSSPNDAQVEGNVAIEHKNLTSIQFLHQKTQLGGHSKRQKIKSAKEKQKPKKRIEKAIGYYKSIEPDRGVLTCDATSESSNAGHGATAPLSLDVNGIVSETVPSNERSSRSRGLVSAPSHKLNSGSILRGVLVDITKEGNIISGGQDNAPRTFGKRSRILAQNKKWSSALTSNDPFESVPNPDEPDGKETSPAVTRRSTRKRMLTRRTSPAGGM